MSEVRWDAVMASRYPEMSGASLNALDGPQKGVGAWLRAEPGTNLLLLGPVGSGKSFAAFAVLREKYISGEKVQLKNVPWLLEELRRQQNVYPSPMDVLVKADNLLLDDFGAKRFTEWGQEQLYLLCSERHMKHLPTIITANFSLEDLKEELDPRLFSRLLHRAIVLYLTGKDRRLA